MKHQDPRKKPLGRENYHEHDTLPEGLLPADSPVASATECTGLMFTPPEGQAQLESYQELSPMAIPRREPGGSAHSKGCPGTGKRPEKRQ